MIKRIGLFTPFAILVIMGLLTHEKFYKLAGMNMQEAGYLGIINTFILFPIVFLIYGLYCAVCGKDALFSVIATFILYMFIIFKSYVKYIQFSLCLISINIFLISYFIMRMHLNQKRI
ncbi:hypothetical protein TEMA_14470 [Terrisporobacter mayombei]|uniref:Uncharacterized protein n=1 Tax=Terrisporobacter mayombei TaxID=1541 RepID=A0ABY9Q235_9FIRM|nr:hypothetical protein TEMA_14470 [Terrisporobacter mayombei]